MTGGGDGAALRGQQDGAGGGVADGRAGMAAREAVVQAAVADQRVQIVPLRVRPEVFGEAPGAGPAGLVRSERGRGIRQHVGQEVGVVGHEQPGPEVAHRRLQVREGPVEPGLARCVLRREVVEQHGQAGVELPARVDPARVQRRAGIALAGGGIDADADGGDLDDGAAFAGEVRPLTDEDALFGEPGDAGVVGIEAGGLDGEGEGMEGHECNPVGNDAGPGGRGGRGFAERGGRGSPGMVGGARGECPPARPDAGSPGGGMGGVQGEWGEGWSRALSQRSP